MKFESLKAVTFGVVATLISATASAQSEAYERAQSAIRAQDWQLALDQLDLVIDEDESLADAALYWKAYALCKSGRELPGRRVIRELRRRHPGSDWQDEAGELRIDCGGEAAVRIEDLDPEMQVFALSQMIDTDPEGAVEAIRRILTETESNEVRRQAVFVLGMSENPLARQVIGEVATRSENLSIRREAVQMLGAAGDAESVELLRALYASETDLGIKRSIIHAYMVADAADALEDALGQTDEMGLQREIVHMLGTLGRVDFLPDLYADSEPELRRAIIDALMVAEQPDALQRALELETDPRLRRALVQGIAVAGANSNPEWLEQAYERASTVEEKRAILEAIIIVDDPSQAELALRVALDNQDTALRRTAIEVLGLMERTDALARLYGELEDPALRRSVLQAIGIADSPQHLIDILEVEQDSKLRREAIQALAFADDMAGANYIVQEYPAASTQEKRAMLDALTVLEDAEGLHEILRHEDDEQMRREIIQRISLVDSEFVESLY